MRAGFYESNITPPLGGFIPGGVAPSYGEDIDEELYTKAVVIEDEGEVAVLISVDSEGLPDDIHDVVAKRIYEYTGIDSSRISISALHTHKGAPIQDTEWMGCCADKAFSDVCYRKIADTVTLAYRRMKDVTVHFDTVEVPGIAHNRTSVMPDGTYRTWIADDSIEVSKLGGEDHTFTVMTFKAGDTPIGCISSFAVHQDTSGHTGFHSGDFSSVLSLCLKEKYGNNFISLFLLGTCGDVNHIDHNVKARPDYLCYHRVIGRKLADAASVLIDNPTPINGTGVKVAKERFTFRQRTPALQEAIKDLSKIEDRCDEFFINMFKRRYLHHLATNKTSEIDLYLQCVKIGDVCIHLLPGEQFAETGLAIKKDSPFDKCFVVEQTNFSCGYVPTKKAFKEGSDMLYETCLGPHSRLVPEAADLFAENSVKLAKTLK